MPPKIQTRWQAFLVHLSISFVIFFVAASIILLIWYPSYFRHFGGTHGVLLIAVIDLILGPLLTLIVFNRAKRHLKWDLTAIGILQIAALCYGMWSVHLGRPLAQVLTHKGIFIVTWYDLQTYKIAKPLFEELDQFPAVVYLELPQHQGDIDQIAYLSETVDGLPIALRPDLYADFPANNLDNVKWLTRDSTFNPTKNCVLLPLISSPNEEVLCLELETGKLIF